MLAIACKIQVWNRLKIQFIKLHTSNGEFQKSSADKYGECVGKFEINGISFCMLYCPIKIVDKQTNKKYFEWLWNFTSWNTLIQWILLDWMLLLSISSDSNTTPRTDRPHLQGRSNRALPPSPPPSFSDFANTRKPSNKPFSFERPSSQNLSYKKDGKQAGLQFFFDSLHPSKFLDLPSERYLRNRLLHPL